MVIQQRRRSTPSQTTFYEIRRPVEASPLSCPSEVKMGDGRHSPTDWIRQHSTVSPFSIPSPAKAETTTNNNYATPMRNSFTFFVSQQWWTRLFIAFSLALALYTGKQMYQYKSLVHDMEREMMELGDSLVKHEAAKEESRQILSQVQAERSEARSKNDKLQHEMKMILEMQQYGEDVDVDVTDDGMPSLEGRMEKRRQGLQHHLQSLQTFFQGQSRQALQERFGLHPHRVEILTEMKLTSNQLPSRRSFIVEMAPMEEMPHSVYFFLDCVERKLWDDTVFLYDHFNAHVLAAVPIDYHNQGIKQNDLQRLELQTLAFPEYSAQHPHEKYTLGFADLGPTFYVNMKNNTQLNGPGGQMHHRLPQDADPCFGHVVSGHDVVDDLLAYGKLQSPLSNDGDHPWVDSDHKMIRIVSITILDVA